MSWETRPLLVAEDNDDDFFLLDRAFKKSGVPNPVQRMVDGQEVINYLSGTAPYSDRVAHPYPFVLLLDLKLPIKHGFDVLEWIREHEATKVLPVVVLSSSQLGEDIHRSYELGANAFVSKSTSVEGLVETVGAIKEFWLKVNRASPRILP